MDLMFPHYDVTIANNITNFCFRLAKHINVSFCKPENEISNVVIYVIKMKNKRRIVK